MSMRKKTIIASIIILLYAPLSAAQKGEVLFLIGKGKVTDGGIKKTIEKGMKLSPEAVIRLENKSLLIVIYAGKKYTIRSAKDVRLSEIASVKPEETAPPLMKIFDKIREHSQTQVLAVRAEDATPSKNIVWEDDDNSPENADDAALQYSKLASMLSNEKYGDAVNFYNSHRADFKSHSDDAAFAAALSFFYLCRYDESLSLMRPLCENASDLALRESAAFYTAFALHSNSDCAASNSYLDRFLRTGARSSSAPYAWYIMGLNHEALGNPAEAQICFKTVVDTWPSDSIAADAAAYIKK